MAESVGFEGANVLMKGYGDVRDMSVYHLPPANPEGTPPQFISAWRFTPEELAEINRTGVAWISIYQTSLEHGPPPVYVSGEALVTVEGRPSKAEPVLPHKPHGDRK